MYYKKESKERIEQAFIAWVERMLFEARRLHARVDARV
jgi:hypothetical protein